MAQWSNNPFYTELDEIMLEEATRHVGLTAEQFNKVMYNIAYLKKLYGLYKVDLGTVTVVYGAAGSEFNVDITHRQETENGEIKDYLDFQFTVAVARITANTSVQILEPTASSDVEVVTEPLADGSGYRFNFNFKLPRIKTNCVENTNSGNVSYTFINEEDITFTANGISRIDFEIPSTAVHGFYGGANFKVGSTPPNVVFTNHTIYPLKLMRRGVTAENYTFTPNKTVMLVVLCDGINVVCNMIEV